MRNHILHLLLAGVVGLIAIPLGGCARTVPQSNASPTPDAVASGGPNAEVGALAPEISVVTREGGTLHLADLRGKAVLLNFWASWCGPCREEMPRFERASRDLSDRVIVVGVNAATLDSREAALDFADSLEVTFPLVFDQDGSAGAQYGVNALPATFFIDASGTLRSRALGPVLADRLKQGLALAGIE